MSTSARSKTPPKEEHVLLFLHFVRVCEEDSVQGFSTFNPLVHQEQTIRITAETL